MLKEIHGGELRWTIGNDIYETTADASIAALLAIAERLESIKNLLARAEERDLGA